MKNNKVIPSQKVITTFYILVGGFVFIMSIIFVPVVRDIFMGPLLFPLPIFIFSLLGLLLAIFTLKEKVKGKLKKFLLLTGLCSLGFSIGVILHNFFYALGVLTQNIFLLSKLFEILHVIFFFIAIPISPIGFIIGVIGSTAELIKRRKRGTQ